MKKSRKMTLAEENEIRKDLGLEPRKRRLTMATLKAEWKRNAKALPKEQRQRILDMIWSGISFGKIAEQEGIDTPTVAGVFELNTIYLPRLRTETL